MAPATGAPQQLCARFRVCFGSAGSAAEERGAEMEKCEIRNGKVVQLCQAPSTVATKSIPPPGLVSDKTAHRILASQLEQVAGPQGGNLVVVLCGGGLVAGLLAIAYVTAG